MTNFGTNLSTNGGRGAAARLGAIVLLASAFALAQDPIPVADRVADLLAPRSAGFVQDFGVRDVRGQLRLYGKAGAEAQLSGGPKLSATGGAALDVRLFGAMREALAIEAKTELGRTAPGGRERSNAVASRDELPSAIEKVVRVCGFTIRLEDPNGAKGRQKMAPKDLLPGGVMTTVMVGPVPLLLAANAGVGIDLGVAAFDEVAEVDGGASTRRGLEGTIGASVNGWVIAGVGGGCRFASVCAGVKGELKLLEVGAGLKLGIGSREGVLVQVGYKFSPATLKLLAIAYCEVRVGWARIGRKFEYLLYQWSARSHEGTIPVVAGI